MPRFAQNVTIFFLHYISPKYLSKNACNFTIIPSFLAARLPPPNRETGGRMRSTSVPVVFNIPSRKELSTNLRVSSGLSFSSAISVSRSIFFCSVTNFIQSSSTLVAVYSKLLCVCYNGKRDSSYKFHFLQFARIGKPQKCFFAKIIFLL